MQADSPLYVRLAAPLIRPFPDFDFAFIKPIRQRAADLLELDPGNRVIDAGCGPGGSFPYLWERVGASGRVVGVEISAIAAANARRRIDRNGWQNIEVVVSPASAAQLTGNFDGLLAFAAPDVFASASSLLNLSRHLRDAARVVAFGAVEAEAMPGRLLNPLLRLAMSRLSLPTTPQLCAEPWSLLACIVDDLQTQRLFGGTMFLASGTFREERAKSLREFSGCASRR